MAKNNYHPGGSGRGNEGVFVLDLERPSCPECGKTMISSGKQWRCRQSNGKGCGVAMVKEYAYDKRSGQPLNDQRKYEASWGFDLAPAIAHAQRCEEGTRLIVTGAQNNSIVDDKGFLSLKQACKFYNCPLAIIPCHYLNRDTFRKGDTKGYDPKIQEYLTHGGITFGNTNLKTDVKIRPTTLHPLSGKYAHGGEQWIIFGHPQIACEPVPTPGDMFPKKMYTTGFLTLPNYENSDIGEKARFQHSQGALILEKYKDVVFVRQLNWDDKGHFYDLDVRFTPSGYSTGHRLLSLTTGDEHVKWNTVEAITYRNKNSIVKTLRPEFIVRHDILDGYAGSHHHEKNPMLQFIKHHNGDNNYRVELDEVVDFINRTTPKTSKTLIVPSNHHDHLLKYLNRVNANLDHTNALFILEMQKLMREAALRGENYDPFYLYLKDKLSCNFEFLSRNAAYFIGDVDHSQHFDVGVNGSRATPKGLAKSVYKMSGGHGHGGMITQGVYRAGVSTGPLEYERGLSTHSNTHIFQYQNWKRALVDLMYGRYCAPRGGLK